MKPYLSFWNYGYYEDNDPLVFDMYHLSAFLLKNIYGEVHLITDLKGKEKLSKIKSFSSIDTSLEILPKDLRIVWSLGKIYSYKLIAEKNEPFIHIDNDVFLFKELPDDIILNDLIVQHSEEDAYDFYEVEDFTKRIPNPFYLEKHKIHYGANMSIFGGYNIEFIKFYAEEALKLAIDKDNQEFLKNSFFNKNFIPACIVEQYYMSLLANIHDVEVKYMLNGWEDFGDKAEHLGFCHLWGAKNKQREEIHNKIKYLKYQYNLGL
jgi:hypothetical protein